MVWEVRLPHPTSRIVNRAIDECEVRRLIFEWSSTWWQRLSAFSWLMQIGRRRSQAPATILGCNFLAVPSLLMVWVQIDVCHPIPWQPIPKHKPKRKERHKERGQKKQEAPRGRRRGGVPYPFPLLFSFPSPSDWVFSSRWSDSSHFVVVAYLSCFLSEKSWANEYSHSIILVPAIIHSLVRASIHYFVFLFMLLFSMFEMHENEASMKQAGFSFSSEIEKSSFGKRWPRRNIPPVNTPMAMFDQLSTSLEAAWTKLRKEGTLLNQNL